MNEIRKKSIKITNIILTFMYIVWAICFISLITSCNNNNYDYTEGIVINWEELEYTESTKMYTESKKEYKKGDIILVDNVYSNIITEVMIDYPINDYWYSVIFIRNIKKGVKKNG